MVTKSEFLTLKQKNTVQEKKLPFLQAPTEQIWMTVKIQDYIILAGKKVKDFISDFYFICSFGCLGLNM